MESSISGISVFGHPEWFLRILNQEGIRTVFTGSGDALFENALLIHANFENVSFPDGNPSTQGKKRVILTCHKATAHYFSLPYRIKHAQFFSFDGVSNTLMATPIFCIETERLKSFQEFGSHRDSKGHFLEGSGILIFHEPEGTIISFPWDLTKTPQTNKLIPTYLEKNWGPAVTISEVSPGVDSMAVRKAVFFMVRLSHSIINTPLIRLSPIPSGAPFSIVRIDADGFTEKSTREVLAVSSELSIPFTWFIDLRSWENHTRDLIEISKISEVGIHCYHHLTFNTRKENSLNLNFASAVLDRLGITWTGAVAPHGTWNKALSLALKDQGVIYSSEFSASEEDLPFTMNGVLQIPTPPFSLGVWTGARDYWEHLEEQADIRHKNQGVAILYDHPVGRLENNIERFRAYLSSQKAKGVRFITMGEYSDMWLARESLIYREELNESGQEATENSKDGLPRATDFFSKESIDCSSASLTQTAFTLINSSTSGIEQAAWRLLPSIYLYVLGLAPLRFHLLWTRIREKITSRIHGT